MCVLYLTHRGRQEAHPRKNTAGITVYITLCLARNQRNGSFYPLRKRAQEQTNPLPARSIPPNTGPCGSRAVCTHPLQNTTSLKQIQNCGPVVPVPSAAPINCRGQFPHHSSMGVIPSKNLNNPKIPSMTPYLSQGVHNILLHELRVV